MMVGRLLLASLSALSTAGTAYPAWTRARAAAREKDQIWDSEGVRQGAQSFTCGDGAVAVLFIHGFASSPSVFRFMAPALAERGFTCRVMRLPGAGERVSSMLAVTEDDWRAAVAAEADRLRAGHEQLWIVGHSMGGSLAIDYTLRHPGAVDGVVLLAPLIQVSSRRSLGLPPEKMFRLASRVLPPDTILSTAFPVDLHARREGVDELRDRFLPVSMYAAMFRLMGAVRGRSGALRVPTLMVVPGDDRVVSRSAARAYFDDLGATHKKLFVDARAGHVVPLDYDWEEVVALLADFVEQ